MCARDYCPFNPSRHLTPSAESTRARLGRDGSIGADRFTTGRKPAATQPTTWPTFTGFLRRYEAVVLVQRRHPWRSGRRRTSSSRSPRPSRGSVLRYVVPEQWPSSENRAPAQPYTAATRRKACPWKRQLRGALFRTRGDASRQGRRWTGIPA